jgi:hypothetical protein
VAAEEHLRVPLDRQQLGLGALVLRLGRAVSVVEAPLEAGGHHAGRS